MSNHVDSVCAECKNDIHMPFSHTQCVYLSHTVLFLFTHTLLNCLSLSHTHTHTHTCFLSHTHTPLLSLSLTHTHTIVVIIFYLTMFSLQWSCNHIQLTCCVLNASQPPIWLNDHSVFVSPALSDDVIVLVVIT